MILKIIFRVNTVLFNLWIKFFYPNIKLGKFVKINRWPIINVHPKCSLIIGNNVLLNSSNTNYHVNMFKGVKIQCDKSNASIIIGDNSRIHGSCIHAFERIEIGKNCLIAANCQIIDANGHATHKSERYHSQGKISPVFIGDDVWIGTGCIILPGVTIGNGSIIAAGSIVNSSVPENCIYGGNPAKLIRHL